MAKKTHRWRDLEAKHFTPEQIAANRAAASADVLEMQLAELRKLVGKNQDELADLLETTQSELSKLERRDDRLVSTLRRYVEALGGELKVTAVIGDREIKLAV